MHSFTRPIRANVGTVQSEPKVMAGSTGLAIEFAFVRSFRFCSQRTTHVSTLDDWALSLAIRPMKSFTTLAAGSCDGSIRSVPSMMPKTVRLFTLPCRLFDVTNNRTLCSLQGEGVSRQECCARCPRRVRNITTFPFSNSDCHQSAASVVEWLGEVRNCSASGAIFCGLFD